jgi:hypothetical protein
MRNRLTERDLSRIVRRVVNEQPELKSSSGTDQNLILAKDALKIISKSTPITDKETENNIYYALKVLFDATGTGNLGERMKKYDNSIKKYNLFSYLPSSELIVKLKAIQ